MRNIIRTLFVALAIAAAVSPSASGQKKMKDADVAKGLEGYFTLATGPQAYPDANGFIRRWLMLDPISKKNMTNRVFTDSYTREAIMHQYFPGQFTAVPKNGDVEKVTMEYQPPVDLTSNRPSAQASDETKMVKANLYWHALDSDHFFLKLFRFATGLDKTRYGVIFWYVTVINCDEDIENVRLAVGSNCGSMWWLNGEEVAFIATDRHMAVDGTTSKKLTLKKGKNILRGCTINGIGMSECCARFLDETGKPLTNYTITLE
ncbi:MAG: acetylxylan esterase [Bacteroidales bacterium]|nr:acetylxylan esterase [Bacteroidales bacterium]